MKQFYKIIINDEPSNANYFLSHSTEKETVKHEFALSRQKAVIIAHDNTRTRNEPLDPEKLLNGDYKLAASLKKVMLFHYILHSEELVIKNIRIICSAITRKGEIGETIYDWQQNFNTENYPLAVVVKGKLDSAFPQSWKQKDFLKALANTPLVEAEPEWRVVISQIMRHGRQSALEQFTNNWTTFNTMYCWFWNVLRAILSESDEAQSNKGIVVFKHKNDFKDLEPKKERVPEAITINLFAQGLCMTYDYEIVKHKEVIEGELKPLKSANSKKESVEMRIRNRITHTSWDFNSVVSDLKNENSEVYHDLKKQLFELDIPDKPKSFRKTNEDGTTVKIIKAYKCTYKDYNIEPYDYMLFHFCYWLRCNFFHGSIPLTILSFPKEQNITALRIANAIIDDFLAEYFPKCLTESLFEVNAEELAAKLIEQSKVNRSDPKYLENKNKNSKKE